MTIDNLIENLPTTPFLFVGSGLSRRYYNLPDWKGLLSVFIDRLSSDPFAYNYYTEQAKRKYPDVPDDELLPCLASIIEEEFNKKWFSDPDFRTLDDAHLQLVADGQSPFKTEICQYIENTSNIVPCMSGELDELKRISTHSLSGMITTNYDRLLENYADNYIAYIGQDELVFSPIQGWAEIYKIHGCISKPNSIVITQEDYEKFESNCKYLAAKLMTLFMEYPIIFMGYSISDRNIRSILKEIVSFLPDEKLDNLQNRFVYVEWNPSSKDIEVSPSSMTIEDKTIEMTRVRTSEFLSVFSAIGKKRARLPAKVIRMFKQEFYDFTITNNPTTHIAVADIDDPNIKADDLILSIGKPSMLGIRGLAGLTSNEWYRHIVLHNLKFTADALMEYAYEPLHKNENLLPVFRIVSEASKDYSSAVTVKTFDDLLNMTIKKNRLTVKIPHRSVNGVLDDNRDNFNNALIKISYLYENEIDLNQLETFISERLSDSGFLSSLSSSCRSNFKRLIRIYDYMKFGRKVESCS